MSDIKIFENKKVRSQYDADNEIWYFSIVDIVGILTEQPTVDRARNYWKVLKSRLIKEGNETVTKCNQLKLEAEDGKLRLTDVGNVEDIFRLIQSIPSPKAEPFKLWLAKVG
ncbi:MAG: BRO family protein, partial [Bacteroidota bacterium]